MYLKQKETKEKEQATAWPKQGARSPGKGLLFQAKGGPDTKLINVRNDGRQVRVLEHY